MEGKKPKAWRVGRLGRATLLLGVAGATAAGLVLGAGVAQAGVGTDPGGVSLSPATGSTSSSPTWSTNTPCPSTSNGSAVFRIEEGGGNTFSISGTVAGPITSNIAATPLLDPISTIQRLAGLANGGTDELVVYCFSQGGLNGTSVPYMSTYLTISADGTTYSTSSTPPAATATTTTLTASPNPATTGGTITLTATVSDADNSTPAGAVQFEVGGSDIGSPVTVGACTTGTTPTCTATTTTTISTASTYNLSAVFNPNSTSYANSTGNYSETVNPPTSPTSGSEPLAVTVPASGSFTLTVATGTVTLTVNGSSATGALNPVTVSDTRNTFPGWSVSGQESNFTGTPSGTISGDQLGWVPNDTSLGTGVVVGPSVAPGTSPGGLGDTAAVLASATAPNGSGTSVLGAALTLDIPAAAPAGTYAGVMTITAVTSLA